MAASSSSLFLASLRTGAAAAGADDETATCTSPCAMRRSTPQPSPLHIITRCRPGSEQSTATVCQGIEGFAVSDDAQLHRVNALVANVRPGLGAAIIAYGAWGSGKSRAMGSLPSSDMHPPAHGILPQTLGTLFQLLGEGGAVRISCAEVLAEGFEDLLGPDRKLRKLRKLLQAPWSHPPASASASASSGLEPKAAARSSSGEAGFGRGAVAVGRRMPDDWGCGRADKALVRDPARQGNKLKVQALTKVIVRSPAEALDLISSALKFRTTICTSSRQHCHLGHAVVRIDWCPGAAAAAAAVARPRVRAAPGGHEAPPDSRRCCITLLDCSSSAAASCLGQRSALLAKRALLSLNKALSHVQHGEAAMALRECQLTRALMGSVHQVLLVACLGGTLDAPTPGAAAAAAGAPPAALDARAFTAPAAVAAAADEATAELVRLLGLVPRQQQQCHPLRQSRLLEEQQLLSQAEHQGSRRALSPRSLLYTTLPSKKPTWSPLGAHLHPPPTRSDPPTRVRAGQVPSGAVARRGGSPERRAFAAPALPVPGASPDPGPRRGLTSPGGGAAPAGARRPRRMTSQLAPLAPAKSSDAAPGRPAAATAAECRRSRSAFTLPYQVVRGQAHRQRLEEQYRSLIADFQSFVKVKRPLRHRGAAGAQPPPLPPPMGLGAGEEQSSTALGVSPFGALARVSAAESADDDDLFMWHLPDPILNTPHAPAPAAPAAASHSGVWGSSSSTAPGLPGLAAARVAALAAAGSLEGQALAPTSEAPPASEQLPERPFSSITSFQPVLPGTRAMNDGRWSLDPQLKAQGQGHWTHTSGIRAGLVSAPQEPVEAVGQLPVPAAAAAPPPQESPSEDAAPAGAAAGAATAAAAAAPRPRRLSWQSSVTSIKARLQVVVAGGRRCMAKLPLRAFKFSRAAKQGASEEAPLAAVPSPEQPEPEQLCVEEDLREEAGRRLEGGGSEAGGSQSAAAAPASTVQVHQGSSQSCSAASSAGGAAHDGPAALPLKPLALHIPGLLGAGAGLGKGKVDYSAVLDDDADVKLWNWTSGGLMELQQDLDHDHGAAAAAGGGGQAAAEQQPDGGDDSSLGRAGRRVGTGGAPAPAAAAAAGPAPKGRRQAGLPAWWADAAPAQGLRLKRWAKESRSWVEVEAAKPLSWLMVMSRSCIKGGAQQGPLTDGSPAGTSPPALSSSSLACPRHIMAAGGSEAADADA